MLAAATARWPRSAAGTRATSEDGQRRCAELVGKREVRAHEVGQVHDQHAVLRAQGFLHAAGLPSDTLRVFNSSAAQHGAWHDAAQAGLNSPSWLKLAFNLTQGTRSPNSFLSIFPYCIPMEGHRAVCL